MQTIELGNIHTDAIDHFDQYFGGWSILEDRLAQQINALQTLNLEIHAKESTRNADVAFPVVTENKTNVAIIEIRGTMTKFGSSLSTAGSTLLARRKVRLAEADPEIGAIALLIDSPGGTSAGTMELADDLFRAGSVKPTLAFFEDLGASAAYYVGSQAKLVKANRPAFVGSIGTVLVLVDSSQAMADAGLKVHVISTGDFKGAGVPGSELTEQQLADFQKLVDTQNELFLEHVQRGTGLNMSQVRALGDGRVHIAAEAMELGLIDGVSTFEESIEELVSLTKRSVSMSDTQSAAADAADQPQAATLDELRSACPGASAEFLLDQLSRNATAASAQLEFITAQQEQLAAERERAAAAEQRAADAERSAVLPGNDAVETDAEQLPGEAWESAVESEWQKLGKTPQSKREAVVQADLKNPGLREKYLANWRPQPNQVGQPAR